MAAGVYGFYPGVAFCVGLIAAFSYVLWVQIAKRFIDDPLKAFAGETRVFRVLMTELQLKSVINLEVSSQF